MDINLFIQIVVGIATGVIGLLVRNLNGNMIRMQAKIDTLAEAFAALAGKYATREEMDLRFRDFRVDYHTLRNQIGDLRTDHEVLKATKYLRREGD